MKRVVTLFAAAGIAVGLAAPAFAANQTPPGPNAVQTQKLEIALALQQARGPEARAMTSVAGPETVPANTRQLVIDNILQRLYEGDFVSDQQIDAALRS